MANTHMDGVDVTDNTPAPAGRRTPRPTVYKGIQMRSRLEATYAATLDRKGRAWQYEPQAFANESGIYLPDFHVTDVNAYIDTKPVLPTGQQAMLDSCIERMHIILDSVPDARLVIITGTGYPETTWAAPLTCEPATPCGATYCRRTPAWTPARTVWGTCGNCGRYTRDGQCYSCAPLECQQCHDVTVIGWGICQDCYQLNDTIAELSHLVSATTKARAEQAGRKAGRADYQAAQAALNRTLGVTQGERHLTTKEAAERAWEALYAECQGYGIDVIALFEDRKSKYSGSYRETHEQ